MKPQKPTDPMEEAYKQLDGEPASDAVSQAAKGEQPDSAMEENEAQDEQRVQRFTGDEKCRDINEAYAMLFESLAVIMKSK